MIYSASTPSENDLLECFSVAVLVAILKSSSMKLQKDEENTKGRRKKHEIRVLCKKQSAKMMFAYRTIMMAAVYG